MRLAMGCSLVSLLCLFVAFFIGRTAAWWMCGALAGGLLVLALCLSWSEMRGSET